MQRASNNVICIFSISCEHRKCEVAKKIKPDAANQNAAATKIKYRSTVGKKSKSLKRNFCISESKKQNPIKRHKKSGGKFLAFSGRLGFGVSGFDMLKNIFTPKRYLHCVTKMQ